MDFVDYTLQHFLLNLILHGKILYVFKIILYTTSGVKWEKN